MSALEPMLPALRLSGITVPLEWVVLAVLVALFVGLYLGVRAGRWSAGCDDGPPDDAGEA